MIIIKNGYLVTPTEIFTADILLKDGKIAGIGDNLSDSDAKIIDAKGKYILPGGIDVHTHMALPFGGTISADDFENGTKAAAFGGVTTIIDFAMQAKGDSLSQTLNDRLKVAADSYIDYGMHISITDLTQDVMDEIPQTIKNGVPTFKLFMTYTNLVVDDYTLFNAIKLVGNNNGRISVHAENYSMITKSVENLLANNCTAPKYHAISRPDYVEAEAVARACMWAEETNSPLYIVHLSSAKGLTKIMESRNRGGKIFCETCPQYLMLTTDNYEEENFGGAKYVMSPPLRSKVDNEFLWSGISKGEIQVIGSDHCPFNMQQKEMGLNSFASIPNGGPGVETSLMILHSEGVLKNRITLNKMVEIMSQNPAKLFGLGNKGSLTVGKDADIVIFDAHKEVVFSKDTLHSNIDYSVYDGLKITGMPVTTISKGKILCDNDTFFGVKGQGEYLQRKI